MSRTGKLSEQQLENVKSFRYVTCGLTPLEQWVYDPYWNFIANNFFPDWLAPNVLTLMGLIFPLASLITICYLDPIVKSKSKRCVVRDPSFTQTLPGWVWLLAWFADFWY